MSAFQHRGPRFEVSVNFNTQFSPAVSQHLQSVFAAVNAEVRFVQGRATKWGDFRYAPHLPRPIITVNADLNEWAKLLTLLHELAHFIAHDQFGHRIKAHGSEWQEAFRALLIDLLEAHVLPQKLEMPVGRHMSKPRATLAGDPHLRRALREFDDQPAVYLEELTDGSHFEIRGRRFIKEQKRRTRYLCSDQTTGKKFLVHGLTEVYPVQLDA